MLKLIRASCESLQIENPDFFTMKQNAGINVTRQMGVFFFFNSSGSLSDIVISKLQIL